MNETAIWQLAVGSAIVIGLATDGVNYLWHKSTETASLRAKTENYDRHWSRLLQCPFCTSYHIAWWLTLVVYIMLIEKGSMASVLQLAGIFASYAAAMLFITTRAIWVFYIALVIIVSVYKTPMIPIITLAATSVAHMMWRMSGNFEIAEQELDLRDQQLEILEKEFEIKHGTRTEKSPIAISAEVGEAQVAADDQK
jgi:hypothetical protein